MKGSIMIRIGEFSRLTRISVRMLRHYDETGLLVPAVTDGATGYRYYSEDQLPAACRITALRDMGFGLAETGGILAAAEDAQALRARLAAKRLELLSQADETVRRLHLVERALAHSGKDGIFMQHSVILKEIPERTVASLRAILPCYQQEGVLWDTLIRELEPLNIPDSESTLTLAIFHDGEYKDTDVDVEVQKTVRGQYPDTEHVRFRTEPPVTVASSTYSGPYDLLPDVYAAVTAWAADSDYEFDGPMFNIYHVSPHETSDASAYVTEVCYPVRKR